MFFLNSVVIVVAGLIWTSFLEQSRVKFPSDVGLAPFFLDSFTQHPIKRHQDFGFLFLFLRYLACWWTNNLGGSVNRKENGGRPGGFE